MIQHKISVAQNRKEIKPREKGRKSEVIYLGWGQKIKNEKINHREI